MDPELKPCPNPECNGPCPVPARTDDAFWVECFECGLNGPPADTVEESFRLWNLLPRDGNRRRPMSNGPVFPEEMPKALIDPTGKAPTITLACKTGGLTKRELFAAMAMQGMLSSDTGPDLKDWDDGPNEEVPTLSVAYADALLEELGKEERDG